MSRGVGEADHPISLRDRADDFLAPSRLPITPSMLVLLRNLGEICIYLSGLRIILLD